MVAIQLNGHVDEHGRIELSEQTDLPPGDVVITIEPVSAEDEAAESAFDELLASPKSLKFLETLVTKTRDRRAAGQLIDRDPSTL